MFMILVIVNEYDFNFKTVFEGAYHHGLRWAFP